MKLTFNRASLARHHAASLQLQLALARWQGQTDAMPQSGWQRRVQRDLLRWLLAGGISGMGNNAPQTKTAAKGRRSLASQGDSNEEFQFSLIRIRDAAE